MINDDNYQSEEAIRIDVTEHFKQHLAALLPSAHILLSAIKAEPEGQLSAATVAQLRAIIDRQRHDRLAQEMNFWWRVEYLDCLDYLPASVIHARKQIDRLLNMLNPNR